MRKTIALAASFIVMLSLGGVYAFSIFVPELTGKYGFSSTQAQLVFGTLIAVFAVTMIPAGRIEKKYGGRACVTASSILFTAGYLTAAFSGGKFFPVLAGIGILAGAGTGFGYLAAITSPARLFPGRKGLVTGFVTAGFGLASVILSSAAEILLLSGHDVLTVFAINGCLNGAVLFAMSFLFSSGGESAPGVSRPGRALLRENSFRRLAFGIFSGTFSGLLVIGSLRLIGAEYGIGSHILIAGISVFAAANFAGRIAWGFISDYTGAPGAITASLMFQGSAAFLLGFLKLNPYLYLALSAAVGFGFGANFVLFARETAHVYGSDNLGAVYPFVFLGYAAAGILGPLTGGLVYDLTGCYRPAKFMAAAISTAGAFIYLSSLIRLPRRKNLPDSP